MSSLGIMVEVYAGTDIHKAIDDAIQLSKELRNRYIVFDFNGVGLSINSTSSIKETIELYHKMLKLK